MHGRKRASAVVGLAILCLSGCWQRSANEVVVYAALDREFSEPILNEFEAETGIRVLAKYDVESTKTVGLVNAIVQERNRPRCDLFWNNEVLHTMRLESGGLLESYASLNAVDLPAQYVGPSNKWFGFAARARVLVVNTELVPREEFPSSVLDLVDAKWNQQAGIAKPLFGTTATHSAVLFAHWGETRATDFFRQVKEHCQVLSGNKQVAEDVARGRLKFGITDTDDAIVEIENGHPVEIVFPDQGDGEMGTLLIPNTIALIKNRPHGESARKLIDFLLRPEVERKLARGRSAQIPVREALQETPRVLASAPVRWMETRFPDAAEEWETAAKIMQEIFVSTE